LQSMKELTANTIEYVCGYIYLVDSVLGLFQMTAGR